MIKIAISQREEYVIKTSETRDCLDRKWYYFADMLAGELFPIANIPNMVEKYLDNILPDAIILSGGNSLAIHMNSDVSMERDKTERKMLNWAIMNNIPVLGVCRGMQMINHYFGGHEVFVEGHVGQNHSIQNLSDFDFEFIVNSYHNYGITEQILSSKCAVLAKCDDVVEALTVRGKKIWGIMWHPERVEGFSQKDIKFIKKVLEL